MALEPEEPMPDYTPEQLGRWNAWAHANAVAMQRTDHIARLVGFGMLTTAMIAAVLVAMWR
jgi:hypothetical protein